MLDKQTRGAILVLRRKGHSLHRISQLLFLSRNTVKKVIKIGSDVPPVVHRLRKLDAHYELIAQMLAEFDGSLVKVRFGRRRSAKLSAANGERLCAGRTSQRFRK
jgi:hypothetical protein